jgi:hypothetical protein
MERHRHKCPRVKVKILENDILALIDSGAELSCISSDLFDKININNKIPILPVVGVSIIVANGKKTKPIKRQCFLNITFEDEQPEKCFLIVDNLVLPILLGSD